MARCAGIRIAALLAALGVAVMSCSGQPQATPKPTATTEPPAASPQPTPYGCPVTIPNGDGPPGEHPSGHDHGNGRLWTGLPTDGVDRIGRLHPDGSISQKYAWHTVGATGELTITGHRLDAPAPPLQAAINSGVPESSFAKIPEGRFWASTVTFPTEGCWRVTGAVGNTSLRFVVYVAKP